jgi:hypothetical protein
MSPALSTASQVVSPIRPAAPETTTLIGSAIGRSYVAWLELLAIGGPDQEAC